MIETRINFTLFGNDYSILTTPETARIIAESFLEVARTYMNKAKNETVKFNVEICENTAHEYLNAHDILLDFALFPMKYNPAYNKIYNV